MARKPRDKTRDYINNEDLLQALKDYQVLCKKAEAAGKEKPIVPRYIGECFLKLADNIGRSRSFSRYIFLDEMKMDGVINCLKYMNNFNTEKFDKPFAYFTQIIWNSFLTRIGQEKKQLYITFKMSKEMIAAGETYAPAGEELKLNLSTSADYIDDYIEEYERKMFAKKQAMKDRAAARESNLVDILKDETDEDSADY